MSYNSLEIIFDAHCHLITEEHKLTVDFDQLKVRNFLASALSLQEWQQMNEYNQSGLMISAGIHPLYPDKMTLSEVKALCDSKKIKAIGEIGLDFRFDNKSQQSELFIKQLDLARNYNLPVILHLVKAGDILYQLINQYSDLTFIWHNFTGTSAVVSQFLKFNIYFSVNQRFLNTKDFPNNLKMIYQDNKLLLESDMYYPDVCGDSEKYNRYFDDLVNSIVTRLNTDRSIFLKNLKKVYSVLFK